MSDLSSTKCEACRARAPTVTEDEMAEYLPQIPDWEITECGGIPRLKRAFKFKNFAEALAFTNRVGEIAEAQDHHPAIVTEWGKVTVSWWTHSIKGLHQSDFVMAAKTDALLKN